MNLIIGILGRPKTNDKDYFSFTKTVTDVIVRYGHIPLGIIPPINDINQNMSKDEIEKLHQAIDCCDGFILQGGMDYYQYDIEAIKYIYEKGIPILGICLGMQSMAAAFGSTLAFVNDHNHAEKNFAHIVNIDNQSKLYKIIGLNQIQVNSRHKEMVINPNAIKVVAYIDKVIEAIEKETPLFFLGVQWHPEDMIEYDDNSRKIFDSFFLSCIEYSKFVR